MSDTELLREFVQDRSQSAFAELVRRHVDWVHSTALRRVHDVHLAEDVTQAAFLVLAEKAPSLQKQKVLAAWLFHVVANISARVQHRESLRKHHETQAAKAIRPMLRTQASQTVRQEWDDIVKVLDDEVARLRRSDHEVVLLRFYQQKSFAEVVQTLGITEAAARKRVSRAVDKLRVMLARKGIIMPAAALANWLMTEGTKPASAGLKASISAATGPAPRIAALAKGALTMMKLKMAAATFAAVLVLTGVVLPLVLMGGAANTRKMPVTSAGKASAATAPTVLQGMVIDMNSKPIPLAKVSLYDSTRSEEGYPLIASTTTDALGGFILSAGGAKRVLVAIQAAGKALCLFASPGQADEPLRVVLQPAARARVRLIDASGAAVSGVTVTISSLLDPVEIGTSAIPNQLKEEYSATSDGMGICTIVGVPPDVNASYEVSDHRYLCTAGRAEADDDPTPQVLSPAGEIEGRVTFADNGKPASNVRIIGRGGGEPPIPGLSISSSRGSNLFSTTTDADGKYRLGQLTGAVTFVVLPSRDSDFIEQTVTGITLEPGQHVTGKNISLVRGVVIRGKVTRQDTGEPLEYASVSALASNAAGNVRTLSSTRSAADGSYVLHVVPGAYSVQAHFSGAGEELTSAQPDGSLTVERSIALDLKLLARQIATGAAATSQLSGTVVDERGTPIAGATITLARAATLAPANPTTRSGTIRIVGSSLGEVVSGRTTTDNAGKFTLQSVARGDVVHVNKGTMGLLQPVTIGENDRDLKLTLYKALSGSVRLRVIDGGGKALANALIGIRPGTLYGADVTPAPLWGLTDANGSFVFTGASPDRSYSAAVYAPGYTHGRGSVKVPAQKQTDAPPITLYKADGFISGQVVMENGDPMPNVELNMSNPRSGNRTVYTGPDGHFRATRLVAGETMAVRIIGGSTSVPSNQILVGTDDALIIYVPRAAPSGGRGAAVRGN